MKSPNKFCLVPLAVLFLVQLLTVNGTSDFDIDDNNNVDTPAEMDIGKVVSDIGVTSDVEFEYLVHQANVGQMNVNPKLRIPNDNCNYFYFYVSFVFI